MSKTDASSARFIADYLRRGLAEDHTPYSTGDGPSQGLRPLARKTKRMVDQSVQLKNALQALLQRAHPELVKYMRGHMSQWVLGLIREYPTPSGLLEAAPQQVAEIPYVTEAKAKRLIEPARSSVASQQDEDTGLALSLMAEDLLRLKKASTGSKTGCGKDRLWERIKDRRAPHLLKSIGGVGKWNATVLCCEIGDVARFASSKQLVATPGWTLAASRAATSRLTRASAGKETAEVACMRKLLAIARGCWANDRWFDPTFEERLKAHQQEGSQKSSSRKKAQAEDEHRSASSQHVAGGTDMRAPVSRREAAKRRRKATPPQKSVSSSTRDQSTFPTEKIPEGNPSVNA